MTATLDLPRHQQLEPAPADRDGSHFIPMTARAIFTSHNAVTLEFTTNDCRIFADEGHWVLISYYATGLACTIQRRADTYSLETYARGLVQQFDYPHTDAGWQQLIDHSQLQQRDDWLLATISAKEAVVDEDWPATSELLRRIRENHVPCATGAAKKSVVTVALSQIKLMPLRVAAGIRGWFTSDVATSSLYTAIPAWKPTAQYEIGVQGKMLNI